MRTEKLKMQGNELSIRYCKGSRVITFNKLFSRRLFQEGYRFAKTQTTIDFTMGGIERSELLLTKEQEKDSTAIYFLDKEDGNPNAVVTGKRVVNPIIEDYGIKERTLSYFRYTEDAATNKITIQIDEKISERPVRRRGEVAEAKQTKFCPICQRTLPVSEFYSNASKRDGLSSECRECHKEYDRKARESERNAQTDNCLSDFTDKQLFDELKRRGYEGRLTKTQTLE